MLTSLEEMNNRIAPDIRHPNADTAAAPRCSFIVRSYGDPISRLKSSVIDTNSNNQRRYHERSANTGG